MTCIKVDIDGWQKPTFKFLGQSFQLVTKLVLLLFVQREAAHGSLEELFVH